MKVLFSIISVVMISIVTRAQDTITVSDIYQDTETNMLSQFIVDYPNVSASEIKSSIEKWSLTFFANPHAVTLVNTLETMIFEPILVGSSKAGMGVVGEVKVTCNTLFEFQDGKMRVTIVERPSLYSGSSGVYRRILKDSFSSIKEFRSKGLYASTYNYLQEGIRLVDNYALALKSIPVNAGNQKKDW